MSNLTPIATYNLALQPFQPVPAIEDDFPISIRITLASLDPEAADDKAEPSSLRILKKSNSLLNDDYFEDDEDDEDEEDELDDDEEEEKEKSSKKSNGKKSNKKDEEDDDEDEDDEEDDDEDEDDEDDDVSEYIVCTLSPKHQYQQTLDLTITPDEEVYFVVTGSYPIHLTGNYIEHPADQDDEDYDDDDEDYDDEYDLSPDEDEIIYGAPLDDDDEEEESDEEETPKIEEIIEEKEKETETAKESKKRVAEEPTSKKSKKAKKDEKKSVQFSKELEQGPTGSTLVENNNKKSNASTKDKKDTSVNDDGDKKKKFPTKTLLGGVITEDRKIGSGATAKSGNKVGIRYIGKLKNGKVFDKNTSGKPFSFKLGKGECIKGFDLGVTGMAVGGERRVIIPPKMGYGSQALPGIPANSELTFDIKLVSLK